MVIRCNIKYNNHIMFKRVAWVGVLFLSLIGLSSSAVALKIAFPSYIYPGTTYNTIVSSGAVQIVMFNPASGPGSSANSDYIAQLAKNKAAGKQTYGYLGTGYFCAPSTTTDPTADSPYSNRCPIETIKSGIDTWARLYPGIDGIFFDEADSGKYPKSSGTKGKWDDLIGYASSKGMKSIVNFGSDGFSTELVGLNAILVNYEGTAQNYLNTSFQNNGAKYYHIVYEVSDDLVARVASKAANAAGYVHISNFPQQSGAYSDLPSNWAQITQAVGGSTGTVTTPPTPPGTGTPSPGGTTPRLPITIECADNDGKDGPDENEDGTCKIPTDCEAGSGDELNAGNCAILGRLLDITNVLSGLVAVVVVMMIIVGGIQYSTAGGDPQKVAGAKHRIYNAVFAFIAYIFMFSFLQWVVPGGLF